jgi:uncharacterized membrane protein
MHQYHIVSKIAIYLLAVVMIVFGVFYFINPRDLVVFIPSYVPGGIMFAYFVGTAFILVGISFLTNQMVKFFGYALAILLFLFVLLIHLPNWLNAGDKEMKMLAFINLLKDTAIAAFALHIAAGAHHQHLHLEDSD